MPWLKAGSSDGADGADWLGAAARRGGRGGRGDGGGPGGAARHGHGLLAVFVGGGAAALLTAAQKHEVLADDFGGVDLLAILIVVASGFQPAFHVDLLALKQVVGAFFRPPVFHAVPVGLFLPLSGLLVLPLARGSQVEGRDGGAGGNEFCLRVFAEIAD